MELPSSHVWSIAIRIKSKPHVHLQKNSKEDYISSFHSICIAVFKRKQVFWGFLSERLSYSNVLCLVYPFCAVKVLLFPWCHKAGCFGNSKVTNRDWCKWMHAVFLWWGKSEHGIFPLKFTEWHSNIKSSQTADCLGQKVEHRYH